MQRVEAGAPDEWTRFLLECGADADVRPEVFALASRNGWALRELRAEKRSLEDIFVALTEGEGDGGVDAA